jgi:hypothetical protein
MVKLEKEDQFVRQTDFCPLIKIEGGKKEAVCCR